MTECECPEGYDSMYHCKICDCCCFGGFCISEPIDSYEDPPICIQCALNQGMTVDELVSISNQIF